MKTIVVTDDTFAEQVLASPRPVLVDFWASWCTPCLRIAPVLEQIAEEYGDRLTVATVNIDENPKTANQYSVIGIPLLNLYSGGEVIKQISGIKPKHVLLQALGLA